MNSPITAADPGLIPRTVRRHRRMPKGMMAPVWIALALAGIVMILGLTVGNYDAFLRLRPVGFLLCAATGFVFLLPSMYLKLRGRFDFFHPLVYPVLTYLFVAFFLGGLSLLSGLHYPWVMDLVPDPDYYLSLSFLYVIVGFAAMIMGFSFPLGRAAGRALSRRIPDWKWDEKEVLVPGFLLLLIGMGIDFWAIAVGVAGYQVRDTVAVEGGIAYSLTIIGSLGAFLLWWSYFRRGGKTLSMKLLVLVLVSQIVLRSIISGSRATILMAVIGIFAAYWFSGREIRRRTIALFGILAVLAVIVGFNVGTTYRDLKGSEDSVVSPGESLRYGVESLKHLGQRDAAENIQDSVSVVIRRFDAISSFSVIVANYERLVPLESQYGLENSIWTSTWTSLIPRFLWQEKPTISNARAFSSLYFNVATTSFSITVFGDLLRNFGPFGVPAGMLALGILLRVLYAALIEAKSRSIWCAATYFLLLSKINYESFYGNILPNQIRLAFALVLGGIVVQLFIAKKRRSSSGYLAN